MDFRNSEPSLILGLDISTACIGASVIYDDRHNIPQIKYITHIVPKIAKDIKGIEALILRKEIFEKDFLSKIKDMRITHCVIESPITHIGSGNSNAVTISQLLQFNGLLSEGVYHMLGLVPTFVSSYDARMLSFPQLLAVRKFNKKGIQYPLKSIKSALKSGKVVLFGSYPFDCDKKSIMMDMVNDMYPNIEWVKDSKGNIRKENYDACDSLVCALALSNMMRYGNIDVKMVNYFIEENISDGKPNGATVEYTYSAFNKEYTKKLFVPSII